MNFTKEQIEEEVAVLEQEVIENQIVLFNDEVNTFDHVINDQRYLPHH